MKTLLILALTLMPLLGHSQKIIKGSTERVEKKINELAQFGDTPEGNMRVAFCEADKQGREYIIQWMKDSGLEVRIDAAANIIGLRNGTEGGLPVIATGSHIDCVPRGGHYDGNVGVIGALEMIELLNDGVMEYCNG